MANATEGVPSQAKHALYTQSRESRGAARSGADGRAATTASGKDGGARRREEATLITLSEEAQQYLSAKMEAAGLVAAGLEAPGESALEDLSSSMEEYSEKSYRLIKLNMEIKLSRHARENIDETRAYYEKALNAEVTPAVELTGAAKEEALKIARAHGRSKISGYSVVFADEATNKTYILKDDGSVWANETGVPKTQEERRIMLGHLKEMIDRAEAPLDDMIAERDALQAEVDVLQAEKDALRADMQAKRGDAEATMEARKADAKERLADLEARYGSFGDMMSKSGQTSAADQPANGSAEGENTGGGATPTGDKEALAS